MTTPIVLPCDASTNSGARALLRHLYGYRHRRCSGRREMVFRPKRRGSPSLFHPDGLEDRQEGETCAASLIKGGQIIPDDLFAKVELERAGKPLTVFRAALTGREEAGWEDLEQVLVY